ncbi:ABC transporter permease [Fodinicola acaciae]|uniref:ABC transporter permease n=1 Tax=Fodinicola acaciae TaxID=2681555 RepID=UPI001C9E1D69|nr:ABC transporter permease [Fodinicola acaciae]
MSNLQAVIPYGALHSDTTVLAGPADAPNPWLSWSYLQDNAPTILDHFLEHVTLTLESIVIATIIAVPLGLVASRIRWLAAPIIGVTGVMYTIPSLALFAALVPFTGLNNTPVVIGLVMYALLILVRNTVTGLDGVPADVRDAAQGMGYGSLKLFWQVDLPIALPSIMTGIRVATVSTVALVTVGAAVGSGGLGQLILQGFNQNFYRAQIVTASILCVVLALFADVLLATVTRLLSPWARRRAA